MLCEASWRCCSVTLSESGVLSLPPGLGQSFPRCWPKLPHPLLLVLGQPMQGLIWPTDDLSQVCKLWAGHSSVNKSFLEHSHSHLFMYCLWLLSSRVGHLQQRPQDPQKPKIFTTWTFKEKFADPCLRKESFFQEKKLPWFIFSFLLPLLLSSSFLLLPPYLTSILFFLHVFIFSCYKKDTLYCHSTSDTIS